MTTQLKVLKKSIVIHVRSPLVMYIHYLQLQNHTSFDGLSFNVVLKKKINEGDNHK